MGLYKYVVRVRVWGIFMNDKNIFIGVCEDNSLHINLVKGYIDDFFNEFHNYEVLEFVSGEDLLSNYPNNIDLLFLDIQKKSFFFFIIFSIHLPILFLNILYSIGFNIYLYAFTSYPSQT